MGDVIYIRQTPNAKRQTLNAKHRTSAFQCHSGSDRPMRMISAINRIFKFSGLSDLEQLEDAPKFKAGILLTAEMVAKYLKTTEKTAKTA
ncbi:MAG: hypothetical protein H7274_08275 [Rhodoferax sp.]|nr:hypothetical protein [Rhodoferax sp.]